jgi:diguanylate cyclase (GGDEF)-like protein/PAS domain S-box-containing protein
MELSVEYKAVFENTGTAMVIIDDDTTLSLVNAEFERLSGYRKDELEGNMSWIDFVHESDRERVAKFHRARREDPGSAPGSYEFLFVDRGNNVKDILLTIGLIPGTRRSVGSLLDISDRKKTDVALQRERETFVAILEKAPYGVVLIDSEGRYLYMNPEFTKITGYKLEDIPDGQTWFRLAYPDPIYRAMVIKAWKYDIQNHEIAQVFRVICKTGEVKEIEFRPTLLDDGRAILMLADVTERRRAEETIRQLAYRDVVTELPNRVLFNDRLTRALAYAERNQRELSVMLLDLDHFKRINDTLGHEAGDLLLRLVGQRLEGRLRKSDTVARMGGDEFLVLLREITQGDDIATVATKLLEAFREPFTLDGHELHITASIGVAVYPEDGNDPSALVRNADAAMYYAKKKGRDTYYRFGHPGS